MEKQNRYIAENFYDSETDKMAVRLKCLMEDESVAALPLDTLKKIRAEQAACRKALIDGEYLVVGGFNRKEELEDEEDTQKMLEHISITRDNERVIDLYTSMPELVKGLDKKDTNEAFGQPGVVNIAVYKSKIYSIRVKDIIDACKNNQYFGGLKMSILIHFDGGTFRW